MAPPIKKRIKVIASGDMSDAISLLTGSKVVNKIAVINMYKNEFFKLIPLFYEVADHLCKNRLGAIGAVFTVLHEFERNIFLWVAEMVHSGQQETCLLIPVRHVVV